MADKVRINGNQYDFGSTSLKIGDEPIYGYTVANWSQKRERTKGYGAGKHRTPSGRTRGKYTTEPVKFTFRRDTVSQIKLMLAALASDGQSYGNAEVPIVFQYVEDESNQDPVLVEFFDAAFASEASASEEEGGPDMVEVEFDVMRIDETINGKKLTLYDATAG
jgi:hypothetical protein